jgi:hypothetical protein
MRTAINSDALSSQKLNIFCRAGVCFSQNGMSLLRQNKADNGLDMQRSWFVMITFT